MNNTTLQRSRLTATAILVAAFNTSALGQTIDLTCNGSIHHYEPEALKATVGPAATRVDLERKRIVTPFGEFRIRKVEETTIYFDNPGMELVVDGRIDRVTGKMTVIWRSPEEEAKMRAVGSSKAAQFAELRCSVSKRLF
jgi:hypothetical protein